MLLIFVLLILASLSPNKCIKSDDFRYISFQDLQPSITTVSIEDVTYGQMLFDVSRQEILLAAKDVLYRLALSDLAIKEQVRWQSSEAKIAQCLQKGQTKEDCQNYIKVLVANGTHAFACGTDAFSPQCTWRSMDNLAEVTQHVEGIAKCPYNPSANVTALLTDTGEYYFGGPSNLVGSDSLISKANAAVRTGRQTSVRTKQSDGFWLNEPQFVASFETDAFVYLIFRETAVEYINCGKVVYSRIARICKDDQGGATPRDDNWTTFIKARLNCSIGGEYPFYFNEVQSATHVQNEHENVVYAAFATPPNSIAGAAVCAFNLTAIDRAFDGPFKTRTKDDAWRPHENRLQSHFRCDGSARLARNVFLEVSMYPLMDEAVQSDSLAPLHVGELERFTHIAVDVVQPSPDDDDDHPDRRVHVVYISTGDGLVKKLTRAVGRPAACVVEIWETRSAISNMQFLKNTNSLYLTSDRGLVQIGASHCSRHGSRDGCIGAMDPYCGWSERNERCVVQPMDAGGTWLQARDLYGEGRCPAPNRPVDGGWSGWSDWEQCLHQVDHHHGHHHHHQGGVHADEEAAMDKCFCRHRRCDNPPPQSGGARCPGASTTVRNCTVHGGWSDWSQWSGCSAPCGDAVKTRTRTCSNPTPANGGRVCVGQDRAEAACTELPPCAADPVDGGWGPWGEWSPCTAPAHDCRNRTRRCDSPPPRNGGRWCRGNDVMFGECGGAGAVDRPGKVERRVTNHTDWTTVDTNLSVMYQRRYAVECRAAHRGQIGLTIEEEIRYCDNGTCSPDIETWSECSATCGGGVQRRHKSPRPGCKGRKCAPPPADTRACNTHACTPAPAQPATAAGSSPACWSDWTPCNGTQQQQRTRTCPACAGGVELERRACEPEAPSRCDRGATVKCGSVGSGAVYLVIGMLVGFLPGLVFLAHHTFVRRKKRTIPSSPHYITEPNPYMSVPIGRNNKFGTNGGTAKSKFTYDETEIATLKRATNKNGQSPSDNYLYD